MPPPCRCFWAAYKYAIPTIRNTMTRISNMTVVPSQILKLRPNASWLTKRLGLRQDNILVITPQKGGNGAENLDLGPG